MQQQIQRIPSRKFGISYTLYNAILAGVLCVFLVLWGCAGVSSEGAEKPEETKTPVTIIHPTTESLSETIELNALSFSKKNILRSNATGLIDNIEINIGDKVEKGQLVFTLKTKEASAMDKNLMADSTLNFQGLIKIKAPKSGTISSIAHQKGDYVQEGDELATIAEHGSLAFLLEVPFELRKYIVANKTCEIVLPDNSFISGKISSALPAMDAQSQTENFVVYPNTSETLPENLIAKIRIVKNTKNNALVLPKQAILANETQTGFWIMKLINDSTAVKVPIQKGIETTDKVEILNPMLEKTDRIVVTGNYGLADTARIEINRE